MDRTKAADEIDLVVTTEEDEEVIPIEEVGIVEDRDDSEWVETFDSEVYDDNEE